MDHLYVSRKQAFLAVPGILASVFHSSVDCASIRAFPQSADVHAFKAVAPEIGPVVVKVRPKHRESQFANFSAHFWATNAWRSKSLPAPQVFDFTSDYCVEQCMPGYHQDETILSPAEQDRFLIHMADLFQQLHSVPCPYYGRLRHKSKDPSSWVKALTNTFGPYFYLLRTSEVLPLQAFARLEQLITQTLPHLTPKQPSLLHGDFHCFNYLVDTARTVTGILDAGDSLGGDPNYDLAYFTNAHPQFSQRIATFYTHYPGSDLERIRTYRAALTVKKLVEHGIQQDNSQRLTRERANLLALL